MPSLMTTFQMRSRRRLAAALLFVWLFALVAGMANACAVGGGKAGPASGASASHAHDDAAAFHVHEAHGDEQALRPSDPGPGDPDEACQKFCDDERSAVNLVAKDLGSPGSLQPLLPSTTTLAWTPADAQHPEAPPADVPACMTGPPIPIRLLRLAL